MATLTEHYSLISRKLTPVRINEWLYNESPWLCTVSIISSFYHCNGKLQITQVSLVWAPETKESDDLEHSCSVVIHWTKLLATIHNAKLYYSWDIMFLLVLWCMYAKRCSHSTDITRQKDLIISELCSFLIPHILFMSLKALIVTFLAPIAIPRSKMLYPVEALDRS